MFRLFHRARSVGPIGAFGACAWAPAHARCCPHGGALALMIVLVGSTPVNAAAAEAIRQTKGTFVDQFRQLDETWPTPNAARAATGEPAPGYWQQRVDYSIDVSLDEAARVVSGTAQIEYHNRSPHALRYLWFQLDQNRFRTDSIHNRTRTHGSGERIRFQTLRRHQALQDMAPGYQLTAVSDTAGRALDHVVVDTLMRVDLREPLASGQATTLAIEWSYPLVEENAVGARGGYETFADGNAIFLIAQWYPRAVAFSDYEGWHNKPFVGSGEFTLEFGDFDVRITVPDDHLVSATGVLQNPEAVLTETQRARLAAAREAARPLFIVTPAEALENEVQASDGEATWHFKAENVRDFAWASSRAFIWDAQGYHQDDAEHPLVMAMSFYPIEGEPLWSRYSTEAVIHTMEVYSRFAFPYPYPTAQSVNGPVGGMEYPMITFNGPRTELRDSGERTYSRATKRFLISVVIHEIGHIYFPMIVNSDERQWTWMDEGVNTFLQFVAEQAWDPDYPSRRGEPRDIVEYMKSAQQVPIMTNSESILQFGNNAYAKAATALVILRETILGRELFDFAFAEYARRWKFKRPTPTDFFRTMEEASGVDLDWFWRGWFYSTDHVDIALDRVTRFQLDTGDPDVERPAERARMRAEPRSRTDARNAEAGRPSRIERRPHLNDLYDREDPFEVTESERAEYVAYLEGLIEPKDSDPTWRQRVLERAVAEDAFYYVLEFSNVGGLVMPIILGIDYADGSHEALYLPAEIWRYDPSSVRKLLIRDKVITQVVVDPHWETADVDVHNNHYPRRVIPSRLELFKRKRAADPRFPDRDLMHERAMEAAAEAKTAAPDAVPAQGTEPAVAIPLRRIGPAERGAASPEPASPR